MCYHCRGLTTRPEVSALKEYIFRDAIHGDISVQDPTVLDLINSAEFQRLRRIRQLGTSFISYPGAEHTRFAHALGVYHLMQRALRHLQGRGQADLSPGDQTLACCAALLHDVGHGPFSHLFEKVSGSHHEQWTVRIITSPDTEIHRCLADRDPDWPERIAGLLTGRWQGAPFIHDLLSSQLDVDRMDYLLRDSVMCGVPYGQFDLDRLISFLTVHDGRLVVHQKGQSAAEAFILARYFMYWNVYFHKATRCIEVILERLLQRAVHLHRAGESEQLGPLAPALEALLAGQPLSLADYLALDEVDTLYAIKQWSRSGDAVLADLAGRFINRRLFKGLPLKGPLPPPLWRAVLEHIARAGFHPAELYAQVDRTANLAYSYYVTPGEDGPQPIQVLTEEGGRGHLEEISRRSAVLKGVTEQWVTRLILFVPREVAAAVTPLLEQQLHLDLD